MAVASDDLKRQGTQGVRVEVIGTGAVRRGDAAVTGLGLGGRRARVALAALALADGPLPADRLAAMIWPDTPPPTWPVALRGVIRSLRTALEPVAAGGQRLILTTPSGYRLAHDASVDLDLMEESLAEAGAMAAAGRHETAIAIAEPLTVLNGDLLLPGEDGSWLTPHRARADALALRALELVAGSAGALGDHHRAVAAGRGAVSASMLNERAHRVLFRALQAAGDRAGVVQAYEACRAVLAEQLGVDPAPETVDAYLAAIGSAPAGGSAGPRSGTTARVPQPTSAFFDRETEAAELAAALREPGLVTVTGRGGVGKTRLVTQVARTPVTVAALSGGRLWVSLAAVDRDELVAAEAAMTLGLPVGTEDAAALVAGLLAPLGRAMLVLDGCEAVLDGTASLAASLLAACPALTLVVTSRVPLAAEAERVIDVAAFPSPGNGGVSVLAASDQVRLLADRVRAGGGELAVDEAAAPFVAELCRRCGGLPLAIELAGAQLAVMSVPDLLDHLSGLVKDGGDRVRGIAQSSYALLDPDEATVFRRLAVLDGPATLPFVREVVATDPIAPVRVVRILRELTARGLLSVDRSGPRWRYHQDDDVHRMARELLDAAGETGEAVTRLADAVSAVLPAVAKAPPEPFLDAINEIIAAVRTVLGAATDGVLPLGRGLDIAFRLHRYWAASNVAEGRFWLSRLVAGAPRGTATAHAIYALGYLGYWAGDTAAAARDLHAAAEQLAGQDDEYAARALIYLGGLADDMDRGEDALGYVRRAIGAAAPFGADLQVGAAIGMGCVLAERGSHQAAGFAAEAIALCRRAGSPEQLAATLPTAAMVCWQVGELGAARGYVAEAMPLLAGSRRIARVVLLSAAAGIALADGDRDAAAEFAAQADADARAMGIDREIPLIRCVLARARLAGGDMAGAAAAAADAIAAARALAFPYPMALCLESAALVLLDGAALDGAGQAGDEELAAAAGRLLATATVIRDNGDRPGPATLAGDVSRARLALAETIRDGWPARPQEPDDAAELAIALLATLAATVGTDQPCLPDGGYRSPMRVLRGGDPPKPPRDNGAVASPDIVTDLVPGGVLRAALNLNNPVLVQGTPDAPTGVTVDIAREIAARLGVAVEFFAFAGALDSFEALVAGQADVCFLAVEPARAAEIAFTAPYTLIEGVYAVPVESHLATVADVDSAGVRIGVKRGSAYDLFLTRTLRQASVVRGTEGTTEFVNGNLDAAAGVREPMTEFVAAHAGYRLIPGRFMEIPQAVGIAKTRRADSARFLHELVEELKASGFIADSLRRSGQTAPVAPPA